MDKLQLCAKAFQKLLEYEYHFIIGRKGKLREHLRNLVRVHRKVKEKIWIWRNYMKWC